MATTRPDVRLLSELQSAVTDRYPCGRGLDFVFHGRSGSIAAEIRAAITNGVVKMNVDSDTQHAFTHAIEEHLEHAPRRTDRSGRRRGRGLLRPTLVANTPVRTRAS
jgi:fructose/tagatose bisphosphate aldolase